MNYEATEYLLLFVLLLYFWWLFFVEQQRYWLDKTRQNLFDLRDELFDAARNGDISFDRPAYKITRNTLNGMIRFTHEANLFYFFSIYITHKFVYKDRRSTDYSTKFDAAIDSLSMDEKRLVLRTIATAHLAVLRHVMSTSPILWPILKPLSMAAKLLSVTDKIRRKVMRGKKKKNTWKVIDAEANYIGTHIKNSPPKLMAAA